MKDINKVIDINSRKPASKQPNSSTTAIQAKRSGDFMDGLFKSLKLSFPGTWQIALTGCEEEVKSLWLRTLIDEKITSPEDISRGLKGARNKPKPFFPSIGEFLSWARPPKKSISIAAHMIIQNRIDHESQKIAPMPPGIKKAVAAPAMNSMGDRLAMVEMVVTRFKTPRKEANKLFGVEE